MQTAIIVIIINSQFLQLPHLLAAFSLIIINQFPAPLFSAAKLDTLFDFFSIHHSSENYHISM
jgi:hypothetical protein